jgi:hypothetical protein
VLLVNVVSFSQTSGSNDLNTEVASKLQKEIAKEAALMKQKLQKDKETAMDIEFVIDTFIVEAYRSKRVDLPAKPHLTIFWPRATRNDYYFLLFLAYKNS